MNNPLCFFLVAYLVGVASTKAGGPNEKVAEILEFYCLDCHDEDIRKGEPNLSAFLKKDDFEGSLIFENLVTGMMPPSDQEQPNEAELRVLLEWLAKCQSETEKRSFRRLSRHEFVHSLNDLLGTNLDFTNRIPEDRGTNEFDSNRNIQLSREMLGSYFSVADEILNQAFPSEGIPAEKTWVTNTVRDSHESYRIYHRTFREGILFSWTRANNGNNYSFFYDHFEPPVAAWYELTFDAAKVAEFEEEMTLQVYAGRYYFADDRPQPQRLVGVISLGKGEVESRSIRAFLKPGENVSVHCYSHHNFRQRNPRQGIYLRQMKVRGPVVDSHPPGSFQKVFGDLPVKIDPGKAGKISGSGNTRETTKTTVVWQPRDDLKRVMRRFAERAFSSKLSEEEIAPYDQVALRRLNEDGDLVQAVKVGLKAILSSPRFLMVPGEHANPSYARAAMLARILWLSVPDDKLLALAATGGLHGETLRKEIVRMLDDERSARMIRSLSDQWLNLRGLNKVTPSLKLYPKYDDLLNYYLPIETRSYLQYLIQKNLPARMLIDSDFTFLNQRLARHYGVEGVIGQKMRRVTLPAGNPRGGLMTMASVLKVTTDGFDTSPILRGAWISKNIVGTPLSPPPESVSALEPEHGEAVTLREQIDQHKSNKTCYACHRRIDPYGFALESFDATGQWRENYKVKRAHRSTFTYRPEGFFKVGAVVDASGEIGEDRFENIFGLKKNLLSNERKIAYHFAKKFFEYAQGEKPNLKQRLHFWDFLGKEKENVRLKNIVTEVLIKVLNEAKE